MAPSDGKSRMLRHSIPAPRSANQQPGLRRRRNKDMHLFWSAMVVYIKYPLTNYSPINPQLLIHLNFLTYLMEQMMKISQGHIIAICEIIDEQESMVNVKHVHAYRLICICISVGI